MKINEGLDVCSILMSLLDAYMRFKRDVGLTKYKANSTILIPYHKKQIQCRHNFKKYTILVYSFPYIALCVWDIASQPLLTFPFVTYSLEDSMADGIQTCRQAKLDNDTYQNKADICIEREMNEKDKIHAILSLPFEFE